MNRRVFIKLATAAALAPALPVTAAAPMSMIDAIQVPWEVSFTLPPTTTASGVKIGATTARYPMWASLNKVDEMTARFMGNNPRSTIRIARLMKPETKYPAWWKKTWEDKL